MQTRNPSDSHHPLLLYDFCGSYMQEVLLENITPYAIDKLSDNDNGALYPANLQIVRKSI